jgi:hypothetical protein
MVEVIFLYNVSSSMERAPDNPVFSSIKAGPFFIQLPSIISSHILSNFMIYANTSSSYVEASGQLPLRKTINNEMPK